MKLTEPVVSGRKIAMGAALLMLTLVVSTLAQNAKRPNIVVNWGDDIGESNISALSFGLMGYLTPNIDRLAKEGVMFTDHVRGGVKALALCSRLSKP